jgi:hypothetical protein
MKLYKMSNYCEVIVKSHLDMDWSGWFEGLAITHNDRGETLFSGRLRDEAAFYGLLVKVRDMGLFLISVKYMADGSFEENGGSDDNS